jgi:hypothetical protein
MGTRFALWLARVTLTLQGQVAAAFIYSDVMVKSIPAAVHANQVVTKLLGIMWLIIRRHRQYPSRSLLWARDLLPPGMRTVAYHAVSTDRLLIMDNGSQALRQQHGDLNDRKLQCKLWMVAETVEPTAITVEHEHAKTRNDETQAGAKPGKAEKMAAKFHIRRRGRRRRHRKITPCVRKLVTCPCVSLAPARSDPLCPLFLPFLHPHHFWVFFLVRHLH